MKPKQDYKPVKDLLLWKESWLKANPEYQRGEVWSVKQKQLFMDSILRRYPLPAIFLHEIKKDRGGREFNVFYDIIDGQQRINALYEYTEGAFPLLDPNDPKAAELHLHKGHPCPWAKKRFAELSDEEQKLILHETMIPVAFIPGEDINRARDLFIRLQGGLPLRPQEIRDAWPGNFTEFILRIGGKIELARYQGSEHFLGATGLERGGRRGATREAAARYYMSFEAHHRNKGFIRTSAEDIDNYYHANVNFDLEDAAPKRFIQIFRFLREIRERDNLPKLPKHAVTHLIGLVDTLIDDAVRTAWETALGQAYNNFSKNLAEANQKEKAGNLELGSSLYNYWHEYGLYARTASDDPRSIERRHVFFCGEILRFMKQEGAAIFKDPRRAFSLTEREFIFFRDRKKCLMDMDETCHMSGSEVLWDNAEIHHVIPHSEGGRTDIDNGALVHKSCHPKKKEDVEQAKKLFKLKQMASDPLMPLMLEIAEKTAQKILKERGLEDTPENQKKLAYDLLSEYTEKFREVASRISPLPEQLFSPERGEKISEGVRQLIASTGLDKTNSEE